MSLKEARGRLDAAKRKHAKMLAEHRDAVRDSPNRSVTTRYQPPTKRK